MIGHAQAVSLVAAAALGLAAGAAAAQEAAPPLGPDAISTIVVKPVTDEPVIRPARRPNDHPYLCSVTFSLPGEGVLRQAHTARLVLFGGEREATSVDIPGGRTVRLSCELDDQGSRAAVEASCLADGRVVQMVRTRVWLPGAGR